MSAAERDRRTAALDPAASFIVEAPAGSGKTELLTQRFLGLLGTVELPEQIVAITFTRKAAAEMRQRVVATLRAAAGGSATVPPHRQLSLELARAALERSDRLGWSLLGQCQRLRILTIDALNASLARQLPVLTHGIVSVEVTDHAEGLYRLAARRTCGNLAEDSPLGAGLRRLLAAADNSLGRLEAWLAGTLPQRDRWLRVLQSAAATSLPEVVAAALERLNLSERDSLRSLVGAATEARLFTLLDRRTNGAAAAGGDAGGEADALARWREAAALLLTASGSWRRRFTRREGVPPEAKALRAELTELRDRLSAIDGVEARLAALTRLPGPALEDAQGEILDALSPVLRHLLAELKLAFAERRSVDHTELALTAQEALGNVDAPSDLLLALDRRIEHILVDEFQDTSHLQWALLERLTAGWSPGDGRSLFLVGDPMQSIYRFRDADLSLFLRARQEGLGGIRLHHLALRYNYRSATTLVDWVNSVFAQVFPAEDSLAAASPGFRAAASGRGEAAGAGARIHVLPHGEHAAEIARVVAIAREESERRPEQSIGVLVRSRTHLIGLRAALAEAGLKAHAVEIDSLSDTQAGQDLIALTRALLHADDRLAWLALLHGPHCGLGWADLEALVGPAAAEAGVPDLIAEPDALGRLSADGRERVAWLRARLQQAAGLRAATSLGRFIRAVWLALDGPAALAGEADLEQAERYFRELDRLGRAGDLDDPAELLGWFSRPGAGEQPAESGIEIMTIHRAKGLEFDTVILPGLARLTRGNEYKLLLSNEINLSDDQRLSLLAGAAGRDDTLYAFLQGHEREQEAAERARLLYVAATRARDRLHLIAAVEQGKAQPKPGSLLATLWPGIADRLDAEGDSEADAGDGSQAGSEAAASAFLELPLRRLAAPAGVPLPPGLGDGPPTARPRPEFEWVHPASVQVGTLIHRELERLAARGAAAGQLVAPVLDRDRFARELTLLGVEPADLDAAAGRVAEALEQVWADPVGRWILEPRAEAWSELKLTLRGPDRLEHVQLDRSFVADGRRWIIDYKTGRHLGADVAGFLDSEVERYREQLERYAAAVAATDPRPLRVGLYFPLMATLRDWAPARPLGSS